MNSSNPTVAALVAQLDADLREAWEERAAVMEFDGGVARELAECLALLELIHQRPADVFKHWC